MKKNWLNLCIFLLLLPVLSAYSETLDASQTQAERFYSEARALEKQEQFREAVALYEKILTAERGSASPRQGKIGLYLNQAAYCYGQLGQNKTSLAYYQEALDIFRELGQDGSVAVLLSNIGSVHSTLGEPAKALEFYQQALVINRKLERFATVAINLNNIGRIYDKWGDYDKAIGFFEEALDLNRDLGKERQIALNLNNLGAVYKAQGRYEEAIKHYEQALAIDRKFGRESGIAIRLSNIGTVYTAWGHYETALEKFEEALEINQRLGRSTGIAITLGNIGAIYQKTGQYEKAIDFHQRSLELDRQIGRKSGIAVSLDNLASCHKLLGDYDKALVLYQEALEMDRQAGRQAGIAIGLNNIGLLYASWGRYDKALEQYQQALEIDRRQGRESAVAVRLNNIAKVYRRTGKYEEAAEYYVQALEINRRLGRKGSEATNLNNLGSVFRDRKRYGKALEYFQQALEMNRSLGRVGEIPINLNNIGLLYQDRGDFRQALEYFQQALERNRANGQQSGVAVNLNNIGAVYTDWGLYDKAIQTFREALELNRALGEKAEIAKLLNNMGAVYKAWGQYDLAQEHYQQALESYREIGEQGSVAFVLNNIGTLYDLRKDPETSLDYFEQALRIARELGTIKHVATYLNNIGGAYQDMQEHDRALDYYFQALELKQQAREDITAQLNNIGEAYRWKHQAEKALEYFHKALKDARRLEKKASVALYLHNIGSMHYFDDDYVEAIEFLAEAVDLKEELRKTASGDARRDYLASQILSYQFLISCYIRIGEYRKAFEVIELSRAKRLEEQLRDSNVAYRESAPSLLELQQSLQDDSAVLVYASTPEQHLARLLVTNTEIFADEQNLGGSALQEFEKPHIQSTGPTKTSRGLNWGESSAPLLKTPEIQEENQTLDFDTLIAIYRQQLVDSHGKERGLALPSVASTEAVPERKEERENTLENIEALSNSLYALLLGDMAQQLVKKTRLLIMPDGQLNFIPFESLLDEQGRCLVERYHIRYAQSIGVLNVIQARDYSSGRRPLLAFGGAVYDERNYETEVIEGARQLSLLRREVDSALERGASLREAYDRLGYFWGNLPGSLAEVQALGGIVGPDAKVLTGKSVSEDSLKAQAESGELADYKVLHFATHGMVVPDMPELSALVLSQTEESVSEEDGYLNILEVAQLPLQADFVNLSACETGLGKLYGGEGVVGLTQAFLVAGANGLSVSLWQVSDESTAQFMMALYQVVQEQQLSYSEAMTEIKRRFIKGDFGEQWQAPYFWAPFVYYGK